MVAAGMRTIPRALGNYIINRDITPYARALRHRNASREKARARARAEIGSPWRAERRGGIKARNIRKKGRAEARDKTRGKRTREAALGSAAQIDRANLFPPRTTHDARHGDFPLEPLRGSASRADVDIENIELSDGPRARARALASAAGG